MEIKFDMVSYGEDDDKLDLENIYIELLPKHIYGVLGNENSGAVEFIKLLTGELIQSAGEIHFNDAVTKPYSKKAEIIKATAKIGYVSDECELQYTHNNIYDLLKSCLLKGQYRECEFDKRIYDALKITGLPKCYEKRNPFTLSTGEQKKLSLTMALIHNPSLLVLVDPTEGLDYYEKEKLLVLLRKLKMRSRKTIVIFTNDLDFMVKIVDDIAVFDEHKLVTCDSKYKVLSETRKLKKIGIETPNIIMFSDIVLKKKKVKMGYRDQMNDLIKDIYRYAQWGRDKYD